MTIMGVFQHPQLSSMRSFVLCKLDPQLCLRISGLLHGFFQCCSVLCPVLVHLTTKDAGRFTV